MVEDLSMRIYNIEALLKVINNRVTALESGRDEKSEPVGWLSSDTLKENQELKHLNAEKQKALEFAWQDLNYYKKRTIQLESDADTMVKDNEQLKRTVKQQAASMHSLYTKNQELEFKIKNLETSNERLFNENQKLTVELNIDNMQEKIKMLEYKIKGDEESYRIQQRLLCECEYRVKELSQDNAALQTKLKFFQDTSVDLGESNNRLRDENHKLKEELSQWNTVLAEGKEAICQNKIMQEKIEKLQRAYSDLRWCFDNQPLVEKQTARKCLELVVKIKNEKDHSGPGYITVFKKIESCIKKEFDL